MEPPAAPTPVSVRDRTSVAIIANPYSGFRANRRRVAQLAAALERRGLCVRTTWDVEARDALLRDADFIRSCRCIIAAGGDGTVQDLINQRPPVPIAVLPLGLENIFAREFGFPADPGALAPIVAAADARWMDLGRARGRCFSLMLTAGLDAAVVHRVAAWRARSRGFRRVTYLSYARHITGATREYRHPLLQLKADGVRVTGCHLLIANLPRYSLHLRLAPQARGDDGLLDWVVFKRPGARNLCSYLWAIIRRRHLQRCDVACGRARRLILTSEVPVPVQTDGDPAGFTPLSIEVVPRAIRVIRTFAATPRRLTRRTRPAASEH